MPDFEKKKRKLRPRQGGGISTPFGGFSRPTKGLSEQDKVRNVVTRLEERRVLPAHLESEWVGLTIESITEVRAMLTEALLDLDRRSAAYPVIDNLRTTCNAYLTRVGPVGEDQRFRVLNENEKQHLLALRESFHVALVQLAADYDLPEAKALSHRIAQSF